MPNKAFTYGLESLQSLDWTAADLRAILLDNTSTAGDDVDAATIDDITTLGEVTGTGYTRPVLANAATSVSEANDLVQLTADSIEFGDIDVGNIYAVLYYLHVTDDTDSIPLLYVDNQQLVTAAAPAAIGDETVYVDALTERILSGVALTFGATIATLTAEAAAGARQLSVSALAGGITLAQTAIAPAEDMPIPTNGSPLTLAHPDAFVEIANR